MPKSSYLEELRDRTLARLGEHIPHGSSVALLDVPCQRNIGDSLILLGELEYLRRLNCRVAYMADLSSFNEQHLRRSLSDGCVLLHGGGNFGDLWEGHQQHREKLVSSLRDYPIIQLPQSVHFESDARALVANRTLGAHPDLTVLAREQRSLDRVLLQLPDLRVALCEDLALGAKISPARKTESSGASILVVARSDREAVADVGQITPLLDSGLIKSVDWIDPAVRGIRSRILLGAALRARWIRRHRSIFSNLNFHRAYCRLLIHLNRSNVDAGVRLLSPHDLIITDRLHVHIMCCMLNKPSIVLNNSDGKVQAVFDHYTRHFPGAFFAQNVQEASLLADNLLEA